jgi:hypothetical protein
MKAEFVKRHKKLNSNLFMLKQKLVPKERASLNPDGWALIPYPNACRSVVVDRIPFYAFKKQVSKEKYILNIYTQPFQSPSILFHNLSIYLTHSSFKDNINSRLVGTCLKVLGVNSTSNHQAHTW